MTDNNRCTRVMFKSIGCRTNQEEFAELTEAFSSQGYMIVSEMDRADIIMVNTCSVTGATESKTRRLLSSIAHDAPHAKILVTGCLAQQNPQQLKSMKNVCWVIGNQLKSDIVPIVTSGKQGVFHTPLEQSAPAVLEVPQRTIAAPQVHLTRTRFPIKIQEGCNFRCSYCIVPSLRGPSRSAPADQILDTFRQAVDAGYKEVVLTGTHIGQYTAAGQSRLTDLVEKMLQIDGDFRVRLSSLDPRDCSEQLFDLVGKEKKMCNHLHVSLQSGSIQVLGAMGRPTGEIPWLLDALKRFREKYPTAGIGADIIVGFPGEQEEDFYETCRVIEQIGLSYIHVFKYSRRPGTAAAQRADQLPETVKNSRSKDLRAIVDKSREGFLKKVALEPLRIIVESESPVRGLTSNYIHVELDNVNVSHNSWLDVYVTDSVRGRYSLARPVNNKVA